MKTQNLSSFSSSDIVSTHPAHTAWSWLPSSMLFVLAIHVIMTLIVVFTGPFPSQVDELQHLSVVRAQFENPTLFPEWSHYRILRPDDLTRWSDDANYINHPSLYYLLLAPLFALTSNPIFFRLVSVLLSTAALAIVLVAARRRFGSDVLPPTLFAVLAASFPKAAVVGGMVNNDNLTALAAAALFGGILGLPGAAWWIMAGLAIAGWTKLTAFIGLVAVAGAWLGMALLSGRISLTDRRLWFAGIGVILGSSHYLFTYLRIDQLLWVNEAVWRIPMAERLHLNMLGFAAWFFKGFVLKWPASEFAYPFAFTLITLLTPLVLAAISLRYKETRPWTLAYAVGVAVLLAIHFGFGWRSYVTLGDLTTMQTRYYNVLWPGIALAATLAIARLPTRWHWVRVMAVIVCLMPTMLGSIVYYNFLGE